MNVLLISWIYHLSIFFSVVFAIVYRRHLRSHHLGVLIPYLLYVLLQESTLFTLKFIQKDYSNAAVYNIYRFVIIIALGYMYYKMPLMYRYKKMILIIAFVSAIINIVNYLFIESIFEMATYTNLVRGMAVTFYAILFLFAYFSLDVRTEEKFWLPALWITSAIAIFYPVVTIAGFAYKYLYTLQATVHGFKLYNLIPQVMSIFMYSIFSYAFYLCQKKNYS